MRRSWSKGLTKETHPSLKKTSETMRRKGIDNFSEWREKMKKLGKIKSSYPMLKKSGDLAEFIGVTLGDGNIGSFPRCECYTLVSNSSNLGFVRRYSKMVHRLFKKQPHVAKDKKKNYIRIRFYEKNISVRLGIPAGSRAKSVHVIPPWIQKNKDYLIRYLRGLFEAEGSLNFHKATYTHKFIFSNRNQSLLSCVFQGLERLGFHPHRSSDKIQLSRKLEVSEAVRLLRFRKY